MTFTSSKPAKLRAACNSCHAAKTKCSGGKTGCERCWNLGLPCKYEVSMVGRVAGIRSRKRRASQSQPGSSSTGGGGCIVATFRESTAPAAAAASTTAPLADHFSTPSLTPITMSWSPPPPELRDETTDTSLSSVNTLFSLADLTTADTPADAFLALDPELERWVNSAHDVDEAAAHQCGVGNLVSSAVVCVDGKESSQEDLTGEARMISACADMLRTLVSMGTAKTNTLDVVLGACRDHVLRLGEMVKDDESEHPAIHCLTSSVLNAVISLFEKSIVEEEGTTTATTATTARPFRFRYGLPTVKIGSLEYDNGDQFALCSYLMAEELRRTLGFLNELRARRDRGMGSGGRASPGAASAAKVQEVWCEEFRGRLQGLLGLLPSFREGAG